LYFITPNGYPTGDYGGKIPTENPQFQSFYALWPDHIPVKNPGAIQEQEKNPSSPFPWSLVNAYGVTGF
jgi:hypothetical protein